MKKFFAALSLSVISFHGAWADGFIPIKKFEIEGAIIPSETVQAWHHSIRQGRGAPHGIQNMLGVEAQDFWTPQAKDVELAESRLRSALEKAVKEPASLDRYATTPVARKYVSQQLERILKHYDEYRRQYIGLVINGKRHIHINSFSSRVKLPYAKEFVKVSDGGFWFWHVLYSIDDGAFLSLSINGEA